MRPEDERQEGAMTGAEETPKPEQVGKTGDFCDNPYGEPCGEKEPQGEQSTPQTNIYGQPIRPSYTESAYAQGATAAQTPEQLQRGDGMSIAAMVLGIVSLLFSCCCGIGAIPAIAAIVLAVIDCVKRGRMNGYAIAGLVLGIVGFLFSSVLFAFFVMVFSDPSFWAEYDASMNGMQTLSM
ncbi:MAG: DUF4190 domain-containing protein [Clostridia bacterium]|nr:DUF4190 domain-containing protein [Clostridia bacterium]